MIEGHGDDAYKYKAIKINFSSNVYNHVDHSGLHQHLFQQMESIRTYPEPEPYSLEKVLAERFHLSSEEVCVTNGATEAIYLIAQTFRNQISAILMPTFSEYADACRLHGHKVVPIYNLNRLPDRGRLIWLCNPNNPTGEVREKEVLTACIKQNPQRIFIMDQSYEFFTQKALLTAKEAAEFPNVILLHSMTKRFAVPGLRLGYITACKELLHEILPLDAAILSDPQAIYLISILSTTEELIHICPFLYTFYQFVIFFRSLCSNTEEVFIQPFKIGCVTNKNSLLCCQIFFQSRRLSHPQLN